MASTLLGSITHSALAQMWAFLKHYDRAIDHYRQVVTLDPAFRSAWRAMGFLMSEQKDSDGAIAAFRRAIALDPGDVDTRFNLGFIHHQRGEHDAAIEQFKAVIAARPILDRAWYGLGVIYLERGELDAAITHLQEAARLQYFNPFAAQHLVLAYARAGRHTEGRKELERLEGFDAKAAKHTADQLAREFTSH